MSSVTLRLCLALALLIALTPLAARSESRHEAAFWFVGQLNVPLGERLSFNVMMQNRVTQDLDNYERTVVRPWVGVALPKGFDVALGYDAHIFRDSLRPTEHRAWQRIGYRHDFGRVGAFGHFWLEERFFERSSSVALRGRFQIGAQLELPREFALVVRNEFFVNFKTTDVVLQTGLRENRLFAGVNRPFGRHLRLEVGYLMQYLDLPPMEDLPDIDVFNHTLWLGVAVKTPQVLDLF